jgi:hypothetical protein
MTDLEIKYLRRLMAKDAAVWAQHHGQALPRSGEHEAATVLREWRAEQHGLTAGSSRAGSIKRGEAARPRLDGLA